MQTVDLGQAEHVLNEAVHGGSNLDSDSQHLEESRDPSTTIQVKKGLEQGFLSIEAGKNSLQPTRCFLIMYMELTQKQSSIG